MNINSSAHNQSKRDKNPHRFIWNVNNYKHHFFFFLLETISKVFESFVKMQKWVEDGIAIVGKF